MWLAIKDKDGDVLYVQERDMREKINKALIDHQKEIYSIVIKSFNNRNEAQRYCDNINQVNKLINDNLNT
jgi:uncharacterized protein YxeA